MPERRRGLHETLVTEAIARELRALPEDLVARRSALHEAEAADRLALHLARVIERAINGLEREDRVAVGTVLARRLVEVVVAETRSDALEPERPVEPGTVLEAVLGRLPDGRAEEISPPLMPLLDTALLTNAPGEPRIGAQVLTEIASADRIDLVMAFIRRSGIRPLLDELRRFCESGRNLRILTTTYTGSTEIRALEELERIGADIRVSYDITSTRLHAKAWLFHRLSGFSTAYIGSSNLTFSAQVSGLEWNVRASGARNVAVVDKVAAVFESYWNSPDFEAFDRDRFLQRTQTTRSGQAILLAPLELRPEPFQERLLELIALAREEGRHRNLLVAATGTGKTVMAALDFARLRQTLRRTRLLFVAHREEILQQSLSTFRVALRDASFGELWVGGHRPERFEHVFASIQSLSASGLRFLPPDHFDVVVVDEFHHAAASSYSALLDHVQPIELLGLTATPERADGLPILDWFDGRIAAELRLWDAIDQHRLVPFQYFGIHDGLDLRSIPWRRGRGYDVAGLSQLLTGSEAWARRVIKEVAERVDDPGRMRALGFCVSIDHARFMARVFRKAGIAATAIWSDTPDEERRLALWDLAEGRVNIVFSVDLFNEGVDVPTVDTLLMLRPTDSPTLFLQQLGRGLRKSPGKTVCTVLDFVGHHRAEFRFDRRLGALLGGSRKDVERSVQEGFPFLPAGCHMELDPVASRIVLENIRAAIPSRWNAKADELRAYAAGGAPVTLGGFIAESGLGLEDVYTGTKGWSDLLESAGLLESAPSADEAPLRKAVGRLLHVDDALRLDFGRTYLARDTPAEADQLAPVERRLARMLIASLVDQVLPRKAPLESGIALLWRHPHVRRELIELFEELSLRRSHLVAPLARHADVPLRVHARYTRIEILAAFGIGEGAKVAPWQAGVYFAREADADLLAFTLDKTSGHFSPTTRYRDYAISRDLIHWESQSVTRADSETGRRYQHHAERGSSVMLFARMNTNERAFHFLGPATYVKHQGEMPMAITWKLDHPLPGDLFASFAAAVA